MSRSKRARAISLQFTAKDCSRCGGQRLAGSECPQCGETPAPHEIQLDLDRRRRVVQAFTQGRDAAMLSPTAVASVDSLLEAMESVQRAVASISRSGSEPDVLLAAFAELDSAVAAWNQPQPRPGRNRARAIGRGARLLQQGWLLFVEALAAPTILDAQELAQRGQELLDEADSALEILREGERFERLAEAGDLRKVFAALGADAAQLIGEPETLTALDRKLAKIYGRDPLPTGAGVQLHLYRYIAVASLDIEVFGEIARETETIALNGPVVAEICRTAPWQREHDRVTALLSAAGQGVIHSQQEDGTDLEVVKALLEVVVTCRDGIIRHVLATLRAGSEAEYVRLVRGSAGGLIKTSVDRFHGLHLDDGLSPAVRNAGAHLDFDIDDDGLVLISGDRFSAEEVLDKVLAYLEVAMGMAMGLSLALGQLNVDIASSRHSSRRDREAAINLFLGTIGVTNIEVEHADGIVRVAGSTTRDLDWMSTIAGLTPILEPSVRAVVGTFEVGEDRVALEANLSAYRNFASRHRDEDDLMVDVAEVVAATTVSGASLWSAQQWVVAAAKASEEVDGETLANRVRRIRRFREYARAVGMVEAVAFCSSVLDVIRKPNVGTPTQIPLAFRRPDPVVSRPFGPSFRPVLTRRY